MPNTTVSIENTPLNKVYSSYFSTLEIFLSYIPLTDGVMYSSSSRKKSKVEASLRKWHEKTNGFQFSIFGH
jgi:beta-lactamase class D